METNGTVVAVWGKSAKTVRIEQRMYLEHLLCAKCGGTKYKVQLIPPSFGATASKYRYTCRDCGEFVDTWETYPRRVYEDVQES